MNRVEVNRIWVSRKHQLPQRQIITQPLTSLLNKLNTAGNRRRGREWDGNRYNRATPAQVRNSYEAPEGIVEADRDSRCPTPQRDTKKAIALELNKSKYHVPRTMGGYCWTRSHRILNSWSTPSFTSFGLVKSSLSFGHQRSGISDFSNVAYCHNLHACLSD